ncbi:hypothetical protein JOC25_000032 [Solibacillus kalamii]|uniref:Uncharacterized protein n=1 Tax=Solibacillus kalamii TaxID=1748298 RepID=A0ABX3ZHM3_9BACL|nr:hypothetical protein [Solibacillus kalamii]MBM7663576.1 hypothetical protein [Solibacillus kalamii]OUZ39162.1 hypothetical protein CBM15_09890 [Solibacillus kalamii]
MSKIKQDKIQMQRKVQGLYREIKQQRKEEKNNNKIGIVIVDICVVLGILILLLNAFIKEF